MLQFSAHSGGCNYSATSATSATLFKGILMEKTKMAETGGCFCHPGFFSENMYQIRVARLHSLIC
jgi:hypothetical protein